MKIKEKKGFTLVEIMIVVAIIGLLAAIAVPNFIQARAAAGRTGCLDQLGKFDSAVVTFWELNAHVWPASIAACNTMFAGGTAPTT
ncbi:MAG: prepilin-type N-terminal cleavage/methylation domain-containing protein, partial [Candidatus Omnitrophota bacterium]